MSAVTLSGTLEIEKAFSMRPLRPAPLNTTVSSQMSRMPRANTGPELLLRRELHRRGLRFKVHPAQLPGRPDIVLTAARLAVFVDGCFWHACPEHGTLPNNNRAWWRAKLARNVARDHEKDTALERLGWTSIHIWEHVSFSEAADAVESLWRERTGRAERPAAGRQIL
jgi:DNA mismatch endonuclease, patch repair protein